MNAVREHNGGRWAAVHPWASVIGGSALAVYGATRKSVRGAALAAAGGYLIYRGASASRGAEPVHVERSYTINKPVEEVYRFWRNFENLPRFMRHLESVRVTGDRWSQWTARAPMGLTVSWDAEITDDAANRHIIWHSLPGSTIDNYGSVLFRPATGNRGTVVTVAIDYRPPAGKVGHTLAQLFGESPAQQIREDLRRFKQLMEAGEIPTIEGQPSGRRSFKGKAMEYAIGERPLLRQSA
jgi:uncharacterized membrane protein